MKRLSLLALTLAACDPTALDDSGTEPGFALEITDASDPDARFSLSAPRLQGADGLGEGEWSPEVRTALQLTLNENSGVDFNYYPGIALTGLPDGVTAEPEVNWFYMMFGGTSEELSFVLTPPADAAPGDTFAFEASVTALSCDDTAAAPEDCPDPNPMSFLLTTW